MTLEYDYATSKSIKIAEHRDDGRGFEFYAETLYKTNETDGYWLLCEGGAKTDLATRDDYGSVSGGTGICILGSHERAYEWVCEYFGEEKAHELIYGNVD